MPSNAAVKTRYDEASPSAFIGAPWCTSWGTISQRARCVHSIRAAGLSEPVGIASSTASSSSSCPGRIGDQTVIAPISPGASPMASPPWDREVLDPAHRSFCTSVTNVSQASRNASGPSDEACGANASNRRFRSTTESTVPALASG